MNQEDALLALSLLRRWVFRCAIRMLHRWKQNWREAVGKLASSVSTTKLWYSHKSLNARPNRPFNCFFFKLSFIKITERISIDTAGKSALKLVNLQNSKVILPEKILPHQVAKSLQTFVWLRARNCHHTTSVRFRVTCTVFLLRSDRTIEIKLSNFSLGGGRPKDCRTSIYGCCWDAYTPRGDVYGIKGCPGKVLIQRE